MPVRAGRPLGTIRGRISSRSWLGGQALGWVGFAVQVAAVSLAPLSLVQAFAAGGLALSVPLAAVLFSQRIGTTQRVAVTLVAISLAALPLGISPAPEHLRGSFLLVAIGAAGLVALLAAIPPVASLRAVSAGLCYGIADAAIKAISLRWHLHGASVLLSGWGALAALGTLAGFVAFQAALASGNPVSAISLMNALAALVALACGALALHESLGTAPLTIVAHVGAIVIVLSCLPLLAEAQSQIADSATRGQDQPLQPRACARPATPKYGPKVQIARQGK